MGQDQKSETYYNQLNDGQKNALKDFSLLGIDRHLQEDLFYTRQVLKLLLFGNGLGLFLVVTVLAALLASDKSTSVFITPIIIFGAGTMMASALYVMFWFISMDAVLHIATQTAEFFLDRRPFEMISRYGFTKKGRITVAILAILGILCFLSGTIFSLIALYSVS